ncbi:hypothetical protein WME89_18000 [Sorangium sp. So ce321]
MSLVSIEDPACRKTFLENVPENARTLKLVRSWIEPGPLPR